MTQPEIKIHCHYDKLLQPNKLKPHPHNPRMHPASQITALAEIIQATGWRRAVTVSKLSGYVVRGHGAVESAKILGCLVPVEIQPFKDAAEETAHLIADNRLPELSAWNDEELQGLLKGMEGGLDLTGFSTEDVAKLLGNQSGATDAEPQIDQAKELNRKWKVKTGDVWRVGQHRLVCGDATKSHDVDRCLDGIKPFMCVTDPPYGVNYDPQWRNDAADAGHLPYAPSRVGLVANDDRSDWKAAWDLFPGGVIYSWHPAGETSLVHAKALQDAGFVLRMQIIWAKANFPIGRGDYHVKHEPCWYAVRKGCNAKRTDDRTQTTLWDINLDTNVEGGHSTQKPLECMMRPIRNHDAPTVYDPFLGSGTTMVAAENLGRKFFGLEISPDYCAVILQRMATAFPKLEVSRLTGQPQLSKRNKKKKVVTAEAVSAAPVVH